MKVLRALDFLSLAALGASVSVLNDWSTPCHLGECVYHIPANEFSMGASVKISGSTTAISDITRASGWEILNCSPSTSGHELRLVCLGDESLCSHIFQDGAEHTIVRLPEECGSGPFARVSRARVSGDQSVPARLLRRRGREVPVVHAFSLDNNFSYAYGSNKGNVSITVYGSSIPGVAGNALLTPPDRRRSQVNGRDATDSMSPDVDIFSVLSSNSGIGSFVRNTTKDSIPINIDEQFNVFNTSLDCFGNTESKLSIDADVQMNGKIDLGVIAHGTIIPPKFDQFGFFASMSADVFGSLSVGAGISGELDSPEITFVTVGLPGLSIPDVISVGPSISLAAKASANVDIDMNLAVGIGYSMSNITLFFPPSNAHNSSVVVAPKDIPLELSLTPGTKSSSAFSAHLIPSLNFGLVAFDISTSAFLNLDTSATLGLDLNAASSTVAEGDDESSPPAVVDGCVDVSGGVAVNIGLEAKSPLFDLLGGSLSTNLVDNEFDFFKQCFPASADTLLKDTGASLVPSSVSPRFPSTGASSRARASSSSEIGPETSTILSRGRNLPSHFQRKSGFSCLATGESVVSTVVNQTFSSESFQPK